MLKRVSVWLAGILLLLSSDLFAATGEDYLERLNLTTRIDNEGRVSPEVFVPHYWCKNWFSGLGFLSSKRTETNSLNGFSESRQAITVDENRISLSVLSWQSEPRASFNYSIGGEVEYHSIDKTEFGYFQVPKGLPLGGDWASFDNNIDITIWKPGIRGGFRYSNKKKSFNIRTDFTVSPFSSLKVKQKTRIKPLVTTTGTSSSSISQDLGYKANIDVQFNIFNNKIFPQLGITALYEFLPLKYDLAILDVNSSTLSYSFTNSSIKLEETTIFIGGRLIFDLNILHGSITPAVGAGVERVKTNDKTEGNGASYTENRFLFTLGFEKRF